MITVGTLLLMPITIPLLWGHFYSKNALVGCLVIYWLCALIIASLAFFDVPMTYFGFSQAFSDGIQWNFQQQFFSVFVAGTFGFLISTLFAPAKTSEHRTMVDEFFKTMKTPIDFEKEIGEGNDLRQLTVIGRFGAAVAVFIALLLLIPNPIKGRIAILILALFIGAISALMIRAGRKNKN